MPSVVGTRKSTVDVGRGYNRDPLAKYAASFNECVQDILNENGVDLYSEPSKAMMYAAPRERLLEFFMEGANEDNNNAIQATDPENFADLVDESNTAIREQFENDREAVLEYASMNSFNPVIGMTFPLHKNILMNNIFDKGAIPKVVAREPKFTITMETRYLVTPDGEEIDMFKDQYKMTDAIDATAPFVPIEITLPEVGTTDVLAQLSATDYDNVSIDSYISAVKASVYLKTGDINPETGIAAEADGEVEVWLPSNFRFVPAYGEYDRTMTEPVRIKTRDTNNPDNYIVLEDVLMGYTKKNKYTVSSAKGIVTDIRLNAQLDTSTAMLRTCSVRWDTRTDIVEIGNAIPINTPISPEEVKDVAALYNTNQLTKIMSMIKTVLGNYKDDKIRKHLDESFIRMPENQKVSSTFDFVPERAGYAFSHITWRKEAFMDYLDHVVTIMLQVLNDPNMTVSIFGSPELVRMVSPTEYTYQTPSNIGPVQLDYTRTVVTSDKRVYQFIGADKLRGTTNFIIILCPRNSERIIYRIYDYQMYVSNEIRNMTNYALPAIHAFERWKFVEYQPVQGRVQILHPAGLTNIAPNDSPIQTPQMNDFNLIKT